jgi:hypothetical protein
MPSSSWVVVSNWNVPRSSRLVENAESIAIPEQDLHPIATPVQEQEQVARARILVKDLLGSTHQAIEAEFIFVGVVHKKIRTSEKSIMIWVPSMVLTRPPLG